MNDDQRPTVPMPEITTGAHYLDRYAVSATSLPWPTRLIGGGLVAVTIVLLLVKVLAGHVLAGAEGPSWLRIGVNAVGAVLVLGLGFGLRRGFGRMVASIAALLVLAAVLTLAWWR